MVDAGCAVRSSALPQDCGGAGPPAEDLSVEQVADGRSTGWAVGRLSPRATPVADRTGCVQDVVEQADDRRREQVLRVYRESVEAGRPLTLKAIAERFGVSGTWVEKTVRQDRGQVVARRFGTGVRAVVRTELRDEILAGIYTPGTRMPTGAALAPRWDTNRRTVNQALHDLVAEGALIHEQHRFVVPTTPGQTGTPTPRQRAMTQLRTQIQAGTYPPGSTCPRDRPGAGPEHFRNRNPRRLRGPGHPRSADPAQRRRNDSGRGLYPDPGGPRAHPGAAPLPRGQRARPRPGLTRGPDTPAASTVRERQGRPEGRYR
jgi:DNA-binding transcriptional regulator YhcF (GntR family)